MIIIENFKKIIKGLYTDNLYKNSFYLMLSHIVNGLLGFVFLIIATSLYSSYDIGIYSAMFSAISLIILFSMTGGLSTALIKLVPSASSLDKNKLVFSFLMISCFIVLLMSFIFVSFIEVFSSKLIFLKENLFYGFIFILFAIFCNIYTLFNGIFMAFRRTKYIFVKEITTNIGKIILLFLFISFLYMGIFYSAGIGTLLGVFISLLLLYKARLINFKLNINFDIIKKNFNYILTNYFSSIASGLFGLLFPILILNILSAEMTAYFFIAWSIFSLITTFLMSTILSFFIEGSYNMNEIKKNKNKGLKSSLIIATISILGVFLFGKFILSLFGETYLNSLDLLYIFTISTYFFVINKIYLVELLIKKKMKETIIFNFLITIPAIIFGTLLMFYFGLIGVGYGWFIGQLIGIIWILLRLKKLSSN